MLTDRELIKYALAEDVGHGDVTTDSIFGKNNAHVSSADVKARRAGIVSGIDLLNLVYSEFKGVAVRPSVSNGEQVEKGDTVAEIYGPTAAILTGERLALNLLSHMCGIATYTSKLVALMPSDCRTRILDTRKTTPLWRKWEKKAVVDGGGVNHRMGLYDHILVKDNHIVAVGSIVDAVKRVRAFASPVYKIEIEIDKLEDLQPALDIGVDWIMLDNMTPALVAQAVEIVKRKVILEASGGINESNLAEYAKTNVDFVSTSELMRSAHPLDLALDFL